MRSHAGPAWMFAAVMVVFVWGCTPRAPVRTRAGTAPGEPGAARPASPDAAASGEATGEAEDPLSGLEYDKLADGAVLVKKGFPYIDTMTLTIPFTTTVLDSPELGALVFSRSLVSEREGKSANSAVNTVWEFARGGIPVLAGDYVYVSESEKSRMEFKENGVLVRGFRIVPRGQYKPVAAGE